MSMFGSVELTRKRPSDFFGCSDWKPRVKEYVTEQRKSVPESTTLSIFIFGSAALDDLDLINHAEKILFYSTSEDACLAHSILKRFKPERAIGDWEEHQQRSAIFFEHYFKEPSLQQKTLFLDANQVYWGNHADVLQATLSLFEVPQSKQVFQAFQASHPSIFMDATTCYQRTKVPMTSRNVGQIQKIRVSTRQHLTRKAKSFCQDFLSRVLDSRSQVSEEALDEVISMFRYGISDFGVEEWVLHLRFLTTENFFANGRRMKISEILIEQTRQLVKKASAIAKSTTNNNQQSSSQTLSSESEEGIRLSGLLKVLLDMANHRFFCHDLFAIEGYFHLCMEVLMLPDEPSWTMAATNMCANTLRRDHKRYATKFAEVEQKYPDPTTRLLVQAILSLWSFLANEDNLSDEEKELKKTHIKNLRANSNPMSLNLLLKGSLHHSKFITKKDVASFTMIASAALRLGDASVASVFYTFLTQVLRFGDPSVCQYILSLDSILEQASNCVQMLLKNYERASFRNASTFYSTLVTSLETSRETQSAEIEESELDQTDLMEAEEEKNEDSMEISKEVSVERDEIMEQARESVKEMSRRTPLQLTLLESSYNLNKRLRSHFGESKEHLDGFYQESNRVEKQHLLLELRETQERLKNEQQHNKDLKERLARMETDRNSKISEAEELRRQLNAMQKQIERMVVANSNQIAPTAPSNTDNSSDSQEDEMSHPLLKLEDPSKISVEDATSFIQLLNMKRTNLRDMRKSLCGSLKNLASDLYTSPIHFLHELIQNAEDNTYLPNQTPFLGITLNKNFILLSNNERGFLPRDVLSICNIAVSTKTAGSFIGKKGLGFKSVFSCTNHPHIISGVWSFFFRTGLPNQDEISYITPHWLQENSIPSQLAEKLSANSNSNKLTHIFLPLKESAKNNSFMDEIGEGIDPRVLINLKKLKQLVIVDEATGKNTLISSSSKEKEVIPEVAFEGTKFLKVTERDCTLDTKVSQPGAATVEISESFRVYECQVEISQSMLEDTLQYSSKTTSILLAFPIISKTNLATVTFPVYCFLPVNNIGLKFMVNCDWMLVTSRESLRENSWNSFLRDCVSKFFVWSALHDPYVRDTVGLFLPSHTAEMTHWWKLFVDETMSIFKNHFFKANTTHRMLLPNPRITQLVDSAMLKEYAGVELIDCSQQGLSEQMLSQYGVEKVSMIEILDCFLGSEEKGIRFSEWANSQEVSWWEVFFGRINEHLEEHRDTSDSVIGKVLECSIFHIRPMKGEEGIQKRRNLPENSRKRLFICNETTLQMWREEFTVLDFSSSHERKFQQEFCEILTPEKLINYLLCIHAENPSKPGTLSQVWSDLEFFKSNWNATKELLKKFSKSTTGASPVCVPALQEGQVVFQPPQRTMIPTLIGISVGLYSRPYFPIFHADQQPYGSKTLEEVLSWEMFFVELGCQLPHLDLSEDFSTAHLRQFTSYSQNEAHLATKLAETFELRKLALIEHLQYLPIVTSQGEIRPVSGLCDRELVGDTIPSVDIPSHAKELASILGVSIKLDFGLCVNALNSLVQKKEVSTTKFLDWLLKLKLYEREKTDHDIESISRTPLLYLQAVSRQNPEIVSHAGFCCKDIIVCERETPAVLLVCSHIHKTIISLERNQSFYPFGGLLVEMGAKGTPPVGDIVKALHRMSKEDPSYFIKVGVSDTFVLSEFGSSQFKLVYQLLEDTLRIIESEKRKEPVKPDSIWQLHQWSWRYSLCDTVDELENSLKSLFPIISHEGSVIFMDQNPRACIQSHLIQAIVQMLQGSRFAFCDVEFAFSCPRIIASLRLNYLEQTSVVVWNHIINNPEFELQELSQVFSRELGEEVTVMTANYISCSVLVSIVRDLRDNPEMLMDEAENLKQDLESYGIEKLQFMKFGKNLIFGSKMLEGNAMITTYTLGLAHFLFLKNPEMSQEDCNSRAVKVIQECRFFRSDQVWKGAFQKGNFLNTDSVEFQPSNLNENLGDINLISMATEQAQETDSETPVPPDSTNKAIHFSKKNLDALFKERVAEVSQSSISVAHVSTNAIRSVRVVDSLSLHKEQTAVGQKAEHFVCVYLQHHYGQAFSPSKNWRSSNRLTVYPNETQNVDDGCGFDFEIDDVKELFKNKKSGKADQRVKHCYIEVKGTKSAWDGTFHVSANEKKKMQEVKYLEKDKASYIVVIVEEVFDPSKIKFSVIHWSEDENAVRLDPETFKATAVITEESKADKNTRSEESSQNNNNRNYSKNQQHNYSNRNQDQKQQQERTHDNRNQDNRGQVYRHQRDSYNTNQEHHRGSYNQQTHQQQTQHQPHQYQQQNQYQPQYQQSQYQQQNYQYQNQYSVNQPYYHQQPSQNQYYQPYPTQPYYSQQVYPSQSQSYYQPHQTNAIPIVPPQVQMRSSMQQVTETRETQNNINSTSDGRNQSSNRNQQGQQRNDERSNKKTKHGK